MQKKWLLAFTLISLLALSPFLGVAIADDSDDDGIDDSIEDGRERELEIEASDDEAKVKSSFDNGTAENEISIVMKTDSGIEVKLEFGTELNASENEIELSTDFRELIEFNDTNGNGLYDNGEEVQTFDLRDLTYTAPNITTVASDDNEAGYQLESRLTGEVFTFKIIGELYPRDATVDNQSLSPSEFKITIVILDFPFLENDTLLALLVKLEAEQEFETPTEDYEVNLSTEDYDAYFSWINESIVDNVVTPINSAISPGTNDTDVMFVYEQGAEIIHDPTLGLSIGAVANPPPNGNGGNGTPTLLDDPTVLIVIASGIVIAIIVAVIVLRRRS